MSRRMTRSKIDVMAYIAPKTGNKRSQRSFQQSRFSSDGYFDRSFRLSKPSENRTDQNCHSQVSSLYIGRDWSRIDIFSEGSLVLSRGIKAGVKTMLEALRTEIEGNLFELSIARSPTKDTARIRAIKKKLKYELEQAHQLFFGEVQDTPSAAAEEGQRLLKEDKLFKMILPALERLVQAGGENSAAFFDAI